MEPVVTMVLSRYQADVPRALHQGMKKRQCVLAWHLIWTAVSVLNMKTATKEQWCLLSIAFNIITEHTKFLISNIS